MPFGVVIALVLAVFLNKKLPGTSAYRTIFFLPMVCAPAAVAMVWRWLYNQQFGLLNNIFHVKVGWINDPKIAWVSIGIIGVWSIIGYNMVLFISGLQEIPHDYYEAADIDGATGIRQFFYITIPLLSPTTFFIVQTRLIGAHGQDEPSLEAGSVRGVPVLPVRVHEREPRLRRDTRHGSARLHSHHHRDYAEGREETGILQLREGGLVMESARARDRMNKIIMYVILTVMAFIMIVPFAWMVLTAVKSNQEAISVDPFYIFPAHGWHWENFATVWTSYNFLILYKNTLLMIFFRVVCACLTATMAGYAFGRLRFPGKTFMFSLVLIQMMVPGQIFIIPQYLMVSKMGMLNTTFGLVFPGIVTAFGTYLLKTGYQGLPRDLEEAASIDGCNIGQQFLLIMMPLTRSSMVSLGIFTAVFAFKDLMWPMIVNTNALTTTLSAALSKMVGQYSSDYPAMMAAATLAILPMVVIYVIFQKQFVEGIATSGGKL